MGSYERDSRWPARAATPCPASSRSRRSRAVLGAGIVVAALAVAGCVTVGTNNTVEVRVRQGATTVPYQGPLQLTLCLYSPDTDDCGDDPVTATTLSITTDATGHALVKTSILFPSAPEGSRASNTPWPFLMVGGHTPSATTGTGYCIDHVAAPGLPNGPGVAPYGTLNHFGGGAYGLAALHGPILLVPCSLQDPPPEVRGVKPYPGEGPFEPKPRPEYPGFPPSECASYAVCEYGSWSNQSFNSIMPPTRTYTGWMGFSSSFGYWWAKLLHHLQ